MALEVMPLSKVATTLGVSEQIVGELVRRGILPILEPPGSEEPLVPQYAVQQVQAQAYSALLRQHIPSSRAHVLDVEYRWGDDMQHWLSHHEEVQHLMEDFLRYVAAMTASHRFKGFKTALGVRAEGRYANLIPQARGLLLTVTRDKKPVRHVIRTSADFAGGLAWILGLEDPKLGGNKNSR